MIFPLPWCHYMSKKKELLHQTYDQNIISAINKLHFPIKGVGGKEFFIRCRARKESGVEHIARKDHRLKVRDIEEITKILKHPQYACEDPDNKIYRDYYGIRKGKDQDSFIKIVTSPIKNDKTKEEIVTIYPTNSIKVEKAKKKR